MPWFCVYVGYAICLVLSLVSTVMVLLYGYNFGPAIALEWLLSVFLAFLISIFLLEPLKVTARTRHLHWLLVPGHWGGRGLVTDLALLIVMQKMLTRMGACVAEDVDMDE